MKTATVRDLRNNFQKLESWLAEGESVEILKQGQPIAMLTQHQKHPSTAKQGKPDFRARIKDVWGDRKFSPKEVEEMNKLFREKPDEPHPS